MQSFHTGHIMAIMSGLPGTWSLVFWIPSMEHPVKVKPSQGVSWSPLMEEAWFGRAALRRGPPLSLESPVRQHHPKPPHRSRSSIFWAVFETKNCYRLHCLRRPHEGSLLVTIMRNMWRRQGWSVENHLTVDSPQSCLGRGLFEGGGKGKEKASVFASKQCSRI